MGKARLDLVDKIGRRPVVLVGMMGVGKTTVGRRLAPRLGLAFKDADEEIEKAAGMPVADLFEAHGEAQFRRGETQVIERLLGEGPAVIATGGGAMANAETRTLIRARSFSIWLHAGLDTIVRRATRRNTRPLLRSGDPAATIAKLLNDRAPHYATADVAVESPEGPHGRTVDAIIRALDARAADHANGVDRS